MDFPNIEAGIKNAKFILGNDQVKSLNRAIRFIEVLGERTQIDFGQIEINPCINGSIQISIVGEKRDASLDINFDKEHGTSFYGIDYADRIEIMSGDDVCIKSIFKISSFLKKYFSAPS